MAVINRLLAIRMKIILILFILLNFSKIGDVFSQNIDSFHFSFDQLKVGDTLKIKSELRDCGEWGGHFEYIDIYYSNGICAYLVRDLPCSIFILERKYLDTTKPFAKTIELSEEKMALVINYISDFLKYKDIPDAWCNAPSTHSIRFKSRKISIYDDECSWNEFIPLRDKLFQTAPY